MKFSEDLKITTLVQAAPAALQVQLHMSLNSKTTYAKLREQLGLPKIDNALDFADDLYDLPGHRRLQDVDCVEREGKSKKGKDRKGKGDPKGKGNGKGNMAMSARMGTEFGCKVFILCRHLRAASTKAEIAANLSLQKMCHG